MAGERTKAIQVQKEVLKAGMLAEAGAIRARLESEGQETEEIFTTQQEKIASLTELLAAQDQPLYVASPAPIQVPRNYLLFVVIGIGILIYLGKIRL